MSTLHTLALALFGASFLVACSPEYSLEVTTEDHGAVVGDQSVSIEVGIAIGVTPLEDDDPIDEDVDVELVSSSRGIMEVAPTGEPREFVLWGVSPGIADVEVLIDGELGGIIAVEVTPR